MLDFGVSQEPRFKLTRCILKTPTQGLVATSKVSPAGSGQVHDGARGHLPLCPLPSPLHLGCCLGGSGAMAAEMDREREAVASAKNDAVTMAAGRLVESGVQCPD